MLAIKFLRPRESVSVIETRGSLRWREDVCSITVAAAARKSIW